jgi:hypothetical protein
MPLSIIIAFGIVTSGVALTWIGIELTFRPQTDSSKKRARILLGVFSVLLVVLTVWATVRSEEEFNGLPKKIAEYIKNTAPPLGLAVSSTPFAPGPPRGVIAVVDEGFGDAAARMGGQIDDFVANQGAPPIRKSGETDVDFVIRSNDWYSAFMNQYKKQFGDQVVTLVTILVHAGVLDKQVINLAENPVNILGVQALARQLEIAGRKYNAQQKQRK